jgi:hypothetical protein
MPEDDLKVFEILNCWCQRKRVLAGIVPLTSAPVTPEIAPPDVGRAWIPSLC